MTLSDWIREYGYAALLAGLCLGGGIVAALGGHATIALVCGLGAGAFLAELDNG